MWAVIKFNKNQINLLKEDLSKKIGNDLIYYSPKVLTQIYKNNRLVNNPVDLLGDYIFCFHKKFEKKSFINELKFTRGLKYFLSGIVESQKDILEFISFCRNSENKEGYVSKSFLDFSKDKKSKFRSGPFTNKIFEIINFQKEKIKISMGSIKTTIKPEEFLIIPA